MMSKTFAKFTNFPTEKIHFSRCQKVAGTMQALLGGEEIYHYHSKLMMKDPKTGGAHIWHQDYGYWYNNGCLLPEMGSVFIPVDPCTTSNSCLQVLSGSHRMGRINHVLEGQQAGADSERFVITFLGTNYSSGFI